MRKSFPDIFRNHSDRSYTSSLHLDSHSTLLRTPSLILAYLSRIQGFHQMGLPASYLLVNYFRIEIHR